MPTNRLEALADGIFAIVMTLLVLDIKVPHLADPSIYHLWDLLKEIGPNLIAYMAGFIILAIYWTAHHFLFSKLKEISFYFIWLNVLFLLAISFIPFATAFLAAYPLGQLAQFVYAIDLINAGVMLYILLHYAVRRRDLVRPEGVSNEFWVNATGKILLPPFFYLLAIIVGFWSTQLSLAILLIGPLVYFIPIDTRLWGILSAREKRLR